jgi:crotonobetaine/carnitine-CoA ligase
MVNNAEISAVIVDSDPQLLQTLSEVAATTPVLSKVIVVGDMSIVPPMKAQVISFDSMVSNISDSNPDSNISSSDDYCIFFTSGTTGLPKGAPISHKTFILSAKSACAVPGITQHSRNYTCLPLFHANAQLYSMTAMRLLGATLILSDKFSPKKLWNEISQYNATYFNSIGGMMQILDSAFKPEDVPDHTAKFVFVGGTPVELWERFEKKFKVDIFEGYSMSEVPVIFGNIHPEKSFRKVGSFGKPIFLDLGRKTGVVDDNNKELTAGVGELVQMGSDFCTRGYWKAPEANKEAFDEEGWFHSGDLVRIDEEGYHYFVDRKKFMIRVAGENVSAFEVEDVINGYPDIAQSAVIPVPDALREEEIKAFVKLKEGRNQLDFSDLIQFCAQRLAYFKVPRFIEIISEFPKTATERIKKVELKNLEKQRTEHGWDRNKEIPDWKERFTGKKN